MKERKKRKGGSIVKGYGSVIKKKGGKEGTERKKEMRGAFNFCFSGQ